MAYKIKNKNQKAYSFLKKKGIRKVEFYGNGQIRGVYDRPHDLEIVNGLPNPTFRDETKAEAKAIKTYLKANPKKKPERIFNLFMPKDIKLYTIKIK